MPLCKEHIQFTQLTAQKEISVKQPVNSQNFLEFLQPKVAVAATKNSIDKVCCICLYL